MADNSSSLSLLTVLKPGGSSHIGAESKPAKTIDQMIALMSERGLVITDEAELRQVLFDCNYYRLSGYFRSFQVNPAAGDNRYRPGTRDVDFLVPYAMDEKLRNIILKGTAKVELTLRSRIAYLLASDGNAYTYMDPESYQDVRSKRGELLRDNLLRNMDKWMKMSNEVCMRHYRRKGGPVPVWAAVETFPFDRFPECFPCTRMPRRSGNCTDQSDYAPICGLPRRSCMPWFICAICARIMPDCGIGRWSSRRL